MIEIDFKCQEFWKHFFWGKILATCTLLASYKCSLFPCKSTCKLSTSLQLQGIWGDQVQSFRAFIWSLINRFLPMQNSAIGEVSCCIHIYFQQLHKIRTRVLRRLIVKIKFRPCENSLLLQKNKEHRPYQQLHRRPSHPNHHTLLWDGEDATTYPN